MLTKDTKLRFWCQKVLPLVYDDSLSYYELLNKVVLHLNQNTDNINQLIDFYNTFAEDVEDIIHQMMEEGEFNEIVADTLGSIVAEEYDPTKSYIIFDYCIFESKLYRANGSTTGVFDSEKWDERTVGYDLTTIQNYIYSLDAGNVAYDSSETYDDDTVGKELKDLNGAINTKVTNQTEIVWIGDSYVQAASLVNAGSPQSARFSSRVSTALGLTEHNYAVGGTDFIYDTTTNFLKQAENAVANLTADQIAKTKYVVVAGGRNMSYNNSSATLSDYNTAIQNCFKYISTNFPNSQIIFIPFLWDANPLSSVYQNSLYMMYYCAENLPKCITVIDNAFRWNLGKYGNILSDNVHPNYAGHIVLANHVLSAILGNNYDATPWFRHNQFELTGLNANISASMFDATLIGGILYYQLTFTTSGIINPNTQLGIVSYGQNLGFITKSTNKLQGTGTNDKAIVVEMVDDHSGSNIVLKFTTKNTLNSNVTYVCKGSIVNGIQI